MLVCKFFEGIPGILRGSPTDRGLSLSKWPVLQCCCSSCCGVKCYNTLLQQHANFQISDLRSEHKLGFINNCQFIFVTKWLEIIIIYLVFLVTLWLIESWQGWIIDLNIPQMCCACVNFRLLAVLIEPSQCPGHPHWSNGHMLQIINLSIV